MMKSKNLPNHIAFIMDGNRRWARKKGLSIEEGHKQGVATIKKIIKHCSSLGIKYLTFYLFSSENWNRSIIEVEFLMGLIFSVLSKAEYDFLDENGVKIKFLSSPSKLSNQFKKMIKDCEDYSAANTSINVNLAFNYGARAEITDAAKIIASMVKNEQLEIKDIDEQLISDNLYTVGIPDPDLLVRTSGEYRISNFLVWQLAYSELYFTDILWPDFNEHDLDLAIEDFSKRDRRYGAG